MINTGSRICLHFILLSIHVSCCAYNSIRIFFFFSHLHPAASNWYDGMNVNHTNAKNVTSPFIHAKCYTSIYSSILNADNQVCYWDNKNQMHAYSINHIGNFIAFVFMMMFPKNKLVWFELCLQICINVNARTVFVPKIEKKLPHGDRDW